MANGTDDIYYAHSAPHREDWELLRDHLQDVAERAASFAAPFDAADEARLTGLLHDLGKYSASFTLRLEGKARGLDHWSAGAWAALTQLRENGIAAAFAIQGHHIGLQSLDSLRDLGRLEGLDQNHPLGLKLTEKDGPSLLQRLETDGLTLPSIQRSLCGPGLQSPPAAAMLDVRMLFSALVDADFLETEAHFQRTSDGRKAYRQEGPLLHAGEALAHLEERVARLASESHAASEMVRLRSDLLQSCLEAGSWPTGCFTLSAPTGAGKTLAMLAFALRHAREHGLRRIVIAVPFLSIIEQTVRVYRELFAPVFGDLYVLEHHSLAGTRGEEGDGQSETDRAARQLAENWDAPLVVTTSVQLLESLLANRPSACRKLHRLAHSVILLDEVQTLPSQLAAPTLATLSHLAARYGSSVVFATATQPAFEQLDLRVRPLAASGWEPREIADTDLHLFPRAAGVRALDVRWEVEASRSWERLADELADRGTALCIVNLKRHALALATLLQARGVPGLYHLSTNLCPAHRRSVLAEVRTRLDSKDPKPCLLISTQCVEAGVDVDFPVVYRALGPLDSIAQAAGRANRNGLLSGGGSVTVFLPEEERYPPGGYEQATTVTRLLFKQLGARAMDLHSPELFQRYYQQLYDLTGITEGAREKTKQLTAAIQRRDFPRVAELYRLIEQDAINVVVPYDPTAFADLRQELEAKGRLTGGWIRDARPYTVNLYRPKLDNPIRGFLDPVPVGRKAEKSEDWFLLLDADLYDRDLLGLKEAQEVWIA